MKDSTSPLPPAWVRKRDGTLVPFEADKISRALFAASESLGQPDAFLARELTDAAVHFLANQLEDPTPSTGQISEVVAKIVRELGQPALAQAYLDRAWVRSRHEKAASTSESPATDLQLTFQCERSPTPQSLLRACLTSFALQKVFTRDLVAAHQDGLIKLFGLETPFHLTSCVVTPGGDRTCLYELVEMTATVAGSTIALEGLDHLLVAQPGGILAGARELKRALRSFHLTAAINLNCSTPPAWAAQAPAPLFGEVPPGELPSLPDSAVQDLVTHILDDASGHRSIRVNWHLSEPDFRPEKLPRLQFLARRMVEGEPLAFVLDRPRHPMMLAEGLDRNHPAVLMHVGLHLPALARQVVRQGGGVASFLSKLGSLVRLALSAGVQKRDFLRRQSEANPELARGFLLDRAQLLVAPLGLHAAVALLIGRQTHQDEEALHLARQIVERLREVVNEDASSRHLEVSLAGGAMVPEISSSVEESVSSLPDLRTQLRVATALHESADLGSACLVIAPGSKPRPEQVIEWLQSAWKRGVICCLRLESPPAAHRQRTFDD